MATFVLHDPVNWRFPPQLATKYASYLDSTHWKLFRFNVLAKRGMMCETCRSAKDINLHHKTYVRLGRELPEDVVVLCRACHTKEHLTSKEELDAISCWGRSDQQHPRVRTLAARKSSSALRKTEPTR